MSAQVSPSGITPSSMAAPFMITSSSAWAIIQEGAVIEENCFIGAGAIVKRGMRIPKGHMAYGIPCRIVRPITQAEYDEIRISTQEYQEYKAEYERQEQENDSLL